jgi:hypothetical protein
MRRLTTTILIGALLTANVAFGAGQGDIVQRTGDYWYAYASKLPIGATVQVRTADGKRETGVLTLVDQESITIETRSRVPEPARRIRFAQLDQLQLKTKGSSIGNAAAKAAVGAAIGAGTFFGILLVMAASMD